MTTPNNTKGALVALTDAEIQSVSEYLDDWGCLANPLVLRLLRAAALQAHSPPAPAVASDPTLNTAPGYGDYARWAEKAGAKVNHDGIKPRITFYSMSDWRAFCDTVNSVICEAATPPAATKVPS